MVSPVKHGESGSFIGGPCGWEEEEDTAMSPKMTMDWNHQGAELVQKLCLGNVILRCASHIGLT